MFLCSLTEKLWTKEISDKTGCSLSFEHQCIILNNVNIFSDFWIVQNVFKESYIKKIRRRKKRKGRKEVNATI